MSPACALAIRRRVVVGAALAALALPAMPAAGHSPLGTTFPQDGAVVERLPPIVRINFDGSVRVISVLVTGPGGVHSVSARLASGDRSLVLVRTARPLPGLYRVRWEVEGSDEHSYGGQFTFEALKGPPPAPAPTTPAEPPAATAPTAGADPPDDGSSGGGNAGLITAVAVGVVAVALGAGLARRKRR
jgi:methionine-rich copper-binding protein CopC